MNKCLILVISVCALGIVQASDTPTTESCQTQQAPKNSFWETFSSIDYHSLLNKLHQSAGSFSQTTWPKIKEQALWLDKVNDDLLKIFACICIIQSIPSIVHSRFIKWPTQLAFLIAAIAHATRLVDTMQKDTLAKKSHRAC